jgi:hypothetical protein
VCVCEVKLAPKISDELKDNTDAGYANDRDARAVHTVLSMHWVEGWSVRLHAVSRASRRGRQTQTQSGCWWVVVRLHVRIQYMLSLWVGVLLGLVFSGMSVPCEWSPGKKWYKSESVGPAPETRSPG